MDATHAHNFRLKPVHSNMEFIASSNKTQNVDWQTSVMSLVPTRARCACVSSSPAPPQSHEFSFARVVEKMLSLCGF